MCAPITEVTCEDIPEEVCETTIAVTKEEECIDVPEEQCETVTEDYCHEVYEKQCKQVYGQYKPVCTSVPVQKCVKKEKQVKKFRKRVFWRNYWLLMMIWKKKLRIRLLNHLNKQ